MQNKYRHHLSCPTFSPSKKHTLFFFEFRSLLMPFEDSTSESFFRIEFFFFTAPFYSFCSDQ